jgi:hypothetical protein
VLSATYILFHPARYSIPHLIFSSVIFFILRSAIMASLVQTISTLGLFTLSLGIDTAIVGDLLQNVASMPTVMADSLDTVKFKPKAGTTFNMELSVVPAISEANNPAYHVW